MWDIFFLVTVWLMMWYWRKWSHWRYRSEHRFYHKICSKICEVWIWTIDNCHNNHNKFKADIVCDMVGPRLSWKTNFPVFSFWNEIARFSTWKIFNNHTVYFKIFKISVFSMFCCKSLKIPVFSLGKFPGRTKSNYTKMNWTDSIKRRSETRSCTVRSICIEWIFEMKF